MLEISKQDVQQIRVVIIQDSRISIMLSDELNGELELMLEDGPVYYRVLLTARNLTNSLLLWYEGILILAAKPPYVVIDINQGFSVIVFA